MDLNKKRGSLSHALARAQTAVSSGNERALPASLPAFACCLTQCSHDLQDGV